MTFSPYHSAAHLEDTSLTVESSLPQAVQLKGIFGKQLIRYVNSQANRW
jgi:hypothetical protein